jgi:hypothetical protein
MVEVLFAIATLLAPVFAEYAKIRSKAERQFNFIAAAGVFFLVSIAFTVSLFTNTLGSSYILGQYLFEFLGWIFLVVGALWAVFGGLIK